MPRARCTPCRHAKHTGKQTSNTTTRELQNAAHSIPNPPRSFDVGEEKRESSWLLATDIELRQTPVDEAQLARLVVDHHVVRLHLKSSINPEQEPEQIERDEQRVFSISINPEAE